MPLTCNITEIREQERQGRANFPVIQRITISTCVHAIVAAKVSSLPTVK